MKNLSLIVTLLVVLLSLGASAEERYESVRFAPGTSGVELERELAQGETLVMHLDAAVGQYMTIDVVSVDDNINFYIICEEGQLGESHFSEGSQCWEGTLPVTGTYFIHLGTTGDGGEFVIAIEIE